MPVGTSQRLLRDGHVRDEARFFTVPEFLRQGSALADFAQADPGRHRRARGRGSGRAEAVLVEVFGAFGGPLRLVTLEEAELIKNGANAFLALKISFANEMAGLAEQAGRRRRAGARGDRARPADRLDLSAPELRVRRKLPAQGAPDDRHVRASSAGSRCT